MSKKIKPEELQDLTTEQLAKVVEGAIVEILGEELTVVEAPKQEKLDKLELPTIHTWEEKTKGVRSKIFEFQARGHNHNAIAAMLGMDSDLIKQILDEGKAS